MMLPLTQSFYGSCFPVKPPLGAIQVHRSTQIVSRQPLQLSLRVEKCFSHSLSSLSYSSSRRYHHFAPFSSRLSHYTIPKRNYSEESALSSSKTRKKQSSKKRKALIVAAALAFLWATGVLELKFTVTREEDFDELEKRAAAGNPEEQFHFALKCFNGSDLNYQPDRGFKWLKKAAERGNVHAQVMLGVAYIKGFLEVKNEVEKEGDRVTSVSVVGIPFPEDHHEGHLWLERAAELGNITAQYNLGSLYYKGTGVEKSIDQAIKWYTLAANNGEKDAQAALAHIYLEENSEVKNCENGLFFARHAADSGSAFAQSLLGGCYQTGNCVMQDGNTAIEWYQKAAEQNHAESCFNLAVLHLDRIDDEEIIQKVYEWLSLAHSQGLFPAKVLLGHLLATKGMDDYSCELGRKLIREAEQEHPQDAQHWAEVGRTL